MTHLSRRHMLAVSTSALVVGCSTNEAGDVTAPTTPWGMGPGLPYPVQEIYPALHKGRIHLAGGFVSANGTITGPTSDHIALSPETGVWSAATPLPTPRHHPNLISYQGQLLAIGGFETTSPDTIWIMQPGVWVLDGEAWSDGPLLPQPNGESVTAVLGDQLHVCGGRTPKGEANASWQDHTDVADHFVLAGLTGSWERAAPLPTARNSAAGATLNGQWHVVGGRTVAGGNTPAHEVYDPSEDRWRTAAPMPQGQGGLAAASVGGKLYAFGGEFFDNDGGVFAEAWVYDPASDTWDALPDMPHPRHGLGGVAVGDTIYLIGGALKVGGNKTSDLVETFTPVG